ncbi:tail protein X [Methylobacillus glycogenes]|uniref:tail protein X n=1 Tax=Methylobacillus glycogenes TaxID=406 RepID=UPI00047246C3|nr:tail protein X [Methylobacillus glycogenes]
MQVMSRQGDSIDSICWRHYGRTEGMVEQVLLANQDLSHMKPILPLGTMIDLPEDVTQPQKQMIQLWD